MIGLLVEDSIILDNVQGVNADSIFLSSSPGDRKRNVIYPSIPPYDLFLSLDDISLLPALSRIAKVDLLRRCTMFLVWFLAHYISVFHFICKSLCFDSII